MGNNAINICQIMSNKAIKQVYYFIAFVYTIKKTIICTYIQKTYTIKLNTIYSYQVLFLNICLQFIHSFCSTSAQANIKLVESIREKLTFYINLKPVTFHASRSES